MNNKWILAVVTVHPQTLHKTVLDPRNNATLFHSLPRSPPASRVPCSTISSFSDFPAVSLRKKISSNLPPDLNAIIYIEVASKHLKCLSKERQESPCCCSNSHRFRRFYDISEEAFCKGPLAEPPAVLKSHFFAAWTKIHSPLSLAPITKKHWKLFC